MSETIEGLREERDALRAALQRILEYPVHSEPVGGAYAMQDIAENALNWKREKILDAVFTPLERNNAAEILKLSEKAHNHPNKAWPT